MVNAKFLAFSCVHAPHSSEAGKEFLLQSIEEHRPTHVICLGDLLDAAAASVHPDETSHDLVDEFSFAHDYLRDVRQYAGNAEFVWIHGNHDDNLRAKDPRRIPKQLRSLADWNNSAAFGAEFREWKQIPYVKSAKGIYTLGQVFFYHGFDCGIASDNTEGLQMAYALGGHPWRLAIRGHTHRPTSVTQCKAGSKVLLPWFYANAGSVGLGDQQPRYMQRKDVSQWGVACVVGEVNTKIRVPRSSGKEWEAETWHLQS